MNPIACEQHHFTMLGPFGPGWPAGWRATRSLHRRATPISAICSATASRSSMSATPRAPRAGRLPSPARPTPARSHLQVHDGLHPRHQQRPTSGRMQRYQRPSRRTSPRPLADSFTRREQSNSPPALRVFDLATDPASPPRNRLLPRRWHRPAPHLGGVGGRPLRLRLLPISTGFTDHILAIFDIADPTSAAQTRRAAGHAAPAWTAPPTKQPAWLKGKRWALHHMPSPPAPIALRRLARRRA